MKHKTKLVKAAFLAAFFSFACPAEELKASKFNVLHESAFKEYVSSDFDHALNLLQQKTDVEAVFLRALVHREKYELFRLKEDRQRYKYLTEILKTDLSVTDLPMLIHYSSVVAKPKGSELAVDLIKAALDKPISPENCRTIAALSEDPESSLGGRKEMLSAVRKYSKNVREYVEGGGRMPPDVVILFSDKTFLVSIMSNIDEKYLEGVVIDILENIQDPALSVLAEYGQSTGVLKATAAVKKKIAKRIEKYPKSEWYTAFKME